MPTAIQPEAVVDFLHHFEALAAREEFALIRGHIAENACFRFSDGDFIGRAAIQAAFEKTWRGDPSVQKARFTLSDVVVLTTDSRTATATYLWSWVGTRTGREFTLKGRGTRVLELAGGQFRIVHEHLSRLPGT